MRSKISPNPSLYFVGHFAIDNVIRSKQQNAPTLGGSVSYGSLALSSYTQKVKLSIISHIGEINFNKSFLGLLKTQNIDLGGIKYSNVRNTQFKLLYYNNTRTLYLKSKSPNLEFNDIPRRYLENPPDAIVLVPLCNEITYNYLKKLSSSFPHVYFGIDLQGFIRRFDKDGKVSYSLNKEERINIDRIVNLFGDKLILKGSEEEMSLISDKHEDHYSIMQYFEKFNSKGIFIMTLGEKGSMIFCKGHSILEIPAFKPKKVTDETGAGDVYFSIFLYEFLLSNKSWEALENVALLASAASSFLIEEQGPYGMVTKELVLKRVKEENYIKK
ncbi:MAG: PfkB family carbohydrate kinase [Promethearchaeota archaeon]|jgi:sugar/nucleoside kinase (ribokinase family)